MSLRPVVVILHDHHLPAPEILDPVKEVAEIRHSTAAELETALVGADVLFLYDFFSGALGNAWHAASNLKWVHVAAAGVDAILTDEIRESDVVVTNSRGIFDKPIAEYVLAQILALAKDLPTAWQLQQERVWKHREPQRLEGTRALVVGTGPIGRAIANLLTAVEVEVKGAGRRIRTGDPDFGHVVDTAGLPQALGEADWVIAAAPLTDTTHKMFNADAFAAMKPTARFINVGRGELTDTDALVDALNSHEIAGAALDVVDPEPLPEDHPLWTTPNVSITAHNSGDVKGWREELVRLFVANFERWNESEEVFNVVDKALGYIPGA